MIDTLTYAKKLKKSGVPAKIAEGCAYALVDVLDNEFATKEDFKQLELRMTVKLGSIVVVASGIMLALLTVIMKM